ncbi:predicted protein [Naegleria gruberi]|uniref:Predicted protein n=1 Tax=Naegleria gruberi TaxID=5762 RepID=D2V825_NAEGR|nr:uncharacterized protein NAEGRDRAFT_65005 [Naegleria gruberi]EFC47104.1 predicted protein [Naegleria gruberi]|eukprot:XP_002679848.1 predicted protein [Naegleria gruberi strain NEG-M]
MSTRFALKVFNSLKTTAKYRYLSDLPPSITYPINTHPKFQEILQKKLDNASHVEETQESNPNVASRKSTSERVLLKPDFNIKVDLPITSSTETTYTTGKHTGTKLTKTIEHEVADLENFFNINKAAPFTGFNMENYQLIQSTIPSETLISMFKSHKKSPTATLTADELVERIFDSEEFRVYKEKLDQFITQNNIVRPSYDFLHNIPIELELQSSIHQNHTPLLNWLNEQWNVIVNFKQQLQSFHNEYVNGHFTQTTSSKDEAKLLSETFNKLEEVKVLRMSLHYTAEQCFTTRLSQVEQTLQKIVALSTEVQTTMLNKTKTKYPQLSPLVEKLSAFLKIRSEFLTANPQAHLFSLQSNIVSDIQTRYQQEQGTPDFMEMVGSAFKQYKSQITPIFSVEEYNKFKTNILDNIEKLDNDTYGFLQTQLEAFSTDANFDIRVFEEAESEDSLFSNYLQQKIKEQLRDGKSPFKAIFNLENLTSIVSHARASRSGPELRELLPFYQSKYVAETRLPIHHISTKFSYGFGHDGIKYPRDKIVKLTVRLSDIDFTSEIARQNFIKIVKGDMKAKYKKRFSDNKQSVTLISGIYDTRKENINYLQNLLVEMVRAAESFDTLITDVPTIEPVESKEQAELRFKDEDAKAEVALEAWVRHKKAGKITVGADLTWGEGVKEEVQEEEEIVEDYGYTSYSADDLKDIDFEENLMEEEEEPEIEEPIKGKKNRK